MSYFYLACTVILESSGISFLNKASGFKDIHYLINGLFLLNLGIVTFSLVLENLNMTIANTTWSGLSILLVALIDYFYFHQKLSLIQYLFMALVTAGLMGLNLTGMSK